MAIVSEINTDWVRKIRKGKILLYPTDTVWGIGTAAFSKTGVEKVHKIKQRESSQPLILLVHSLEQLKEYVADIPPRIETLLHYVERPLTLIYPKVKLLPHHVLAEDGSIAIRICKRPIIQDMIKVLDQPIVSTSANISGEDFPSTYDEISSAIIREVDYIFRPEDSVEENEDENQPSVVAKFDSKGELHFLRT
jgi:L-threonylcarbamoyladenylate synthase